MYNKLLERQLQKYLKEVPENVAELLNVISASYDHFEQDRLMLERSIELNSEELLELNRLQKKSSYELKTLFENIDDVFFSISFPDFQLLQMSPACKNIYGYQVSDFQNNSRLWYESIVEEDKIIFDRNEKAMHTGVAFNIEYRIQHKEGLQRWVETKIKPTLDENNCLIRIDGVTSDITPRKRAEEIIKTTNENLKTSIDRLSEAQQIAHLGSWMLDVKTNTKVFSTEFYKIFESSTSKFAETLEEYLTYFHPDDRQMVSDAFNGAQKDHKPYHYEARLLMKDGSIKNVSANGKCILDHNGELIKMNGTIQDVTDQKKIENAMEKNIVELKKSNSELDKFVYSVSHDLRAPLCSMLGVLEIAEDDTTDPLMIEYLKTLEGSVRKLDGFIADILDYSRNSRIEVRNEEIDFKELLDDIAQNLKYMGNNKRVVDIKINVNNSVPVYCDKTRLNIILNNLVSNAIRYQNSQIPNPFVDIKIDTSDTETDIIIRDNGIGISKEFHDKIFDMFYRVSDESIGSGLGLYIVKEAVTRLNGKIEVQSETGDGCTFIIKIPNSNYLIYL
ncbi:MAG: PAS domain-containing sensor histidine kinase [Bacteroidota bacterium]